MTLEEAVLAYIRKRKELSEIRGIIGDELFFRLYPDELRRETRKKEREEKRLCRS